MKLILWLVSLLPKQVHFEQKQYMQMQQSSFLPKKKMLAKKQVMNGVKAS